MWKQARKETHAREETHYPYQELSLGLPYLPQNQYQAWCQSGYLDAPTALIL